jgi:hypothetical protein
MESTSTYVEAKSVRGYPNATWDFQSSESMSEQASNSTAPGRALERCALQSSPGARRRAWTLNAMTVERWLADAVQRNTRILDTYFKQACPCRIPRFVYWVTKEHSHGTDPLQNLMILTCRYYGAGNAIEEVARNDSEGGTWNCPTCSTMWLDYCHERSMLNYEHRFKPAAALPEPFIAQEPPSREPQFSRSKRAEEWEKFMLHGIGQ